MTRNEFHARHCGVVGDYDSLNGRDDVCYCFAFDEGARYAREAALAGTCTNPACDDGWVENPYEMGKLLRCQVCKKQVKP